MDEKDGGRRDPFGGVEPMVALGLVGDGRKVDGRKVDVLQRKPRKARKVSPSERRRKRRQVNVTFSDAGIPERLRALAREWGLVAPDGRNANVSAVVERLLVPALEEAEQDAEGRRQNERGANE